MTELVANFTLNNNPLNADFDLSEGVELNALFQVGDAIWGKIAGDINDQLDLKDIIDTLSSQIEGNHSEITNINTTISGYGNIVTHDVTEFATAAQGALADTALQPNDNISELVNNAGYVTSSALNGYATQEWVGEQGYITGIDFTEVTTALGYTPVNPSDLATVATSGSYTDLINTPSLATVATTGAYSDLTGTPTIPTVNNAKLTIQKNGTTVKTFTANASSNVTCNITVPTSINDLTTTAQQDAINSGATSTSIGQIATNASGISAINDLIPSQATSSNQLADKSFVNSSIATNTANFIGTFTSVADLEAYSGTLTNNDYAFVETTDTAGNTLYDRYKWNGTEWLFEYELNNSSFTSDQWASINSGITANDVTLIGTAVQPSDLATVATSGAYADLTGQPTFSTGLTDTNNTITVTDYSKLLKNSATGSNALTVNGSATSKTYSVNIGTSSEATGAYGTALGGGAYANASSSVAVGYCARVTGNSSIQLGYGTVSSSNQLYVGFNNAGTNWNLLNGTTGYIPNARLQLDTTPTSGSGNPITSGAVYTVLGDIETALNTINSGS